MQNLRRMEAVISDLGPQPRIETGELNPTSSHENNFDNIRYKGPLKVYTRRKPRSQVHTLSTIPSVTPEHSSPYSSEIDDVPSPSEIENEDSNLDVPIAL